MEGADNYGDVQFTGYYTPQGEFRYPLYRMPPRGYLQRRAEQQFGHRLDQFANG